MELNIVFIHYSKLNFNTTITDNRYTNTAISLNEFNGASRFLQSLFGNRHSLSEQSCKEICKRHRYKIHSIERVPM